jgi:hypothetical protein
MAGFIFKLDVILEVRSFYPTSLFKRRFPWILILFFYVFRLEGVSILSDFGHLMKFLYQIHLFISSLSL